MDEEELQQWCRVPKDGLNRSDAEYIVGELSKAQAEVRRLREWVDDLQSGMYVNCVYCGHRYGKEHDVPCTMAEVLKDHIMQCPEHPLSAEHKRADAWRKMAGELVAAGDGLFAYRDTTDNDVRVRTNGDWQGALAAFEAMENTETKGGG